MEKKQFFTTRTIAGLGVLTAMVVVLQLLSNYVQFGPVSITLALFPIAVGAMLFGPLGGLFLGLIDGALIISAPSTISGFLAIEPLGTVFTCLLKTGIAGLVSGLVFNLLKKKNIYLAIILASILVPILNTGLFALAAITIFRKTLLDGASQMGVGVVYMLFIVWIGWNFLLEFGLNAALAPAFLKLYQSIELRQERKK